jgi:hypothetical protein
MMNETDSCQSIDAYLDLFCETHLSQLLMRDYELASRF